jgi:hypothetical protein
MTTSRSHDHRATGIGIRNGITDTELLNYCVLFTVFELVSTSYGLFDGSHRGSSRTINAGCDHGTSHHRYADDFEPLQRRTIRFGDPGERNDR